MFIFCVFSVPVHVIDCIIVGRLLFSEVQYFHISMCFLKVSSVPDTLTLWNCVLLGQKLCTVFEIFLYRAGCARSWYRIQISICYFALLYHCLAVWIFCCAVKETLHNCCILNYWFDFLIIIWWPLDFDLSLASVISCYCVACVIVSIPFDVSVCSRQQ